MNSRQKLELEDKARPLMEWLRDNGSKDMAIIITPTDSELVQGSIGLLVKKFCENLKV